MKKTNTAGKTIDELLSFRQAERITGISEGTLLYQSNICNLEVDTSTGKKRIQKSELLAFKKWYESYRKGLIESTFMLDWDESLKILPTYPYIPTLSNPNRYKKYAHRPCFLISNKGSIINAISLKKRLPQEVDHGYMQVSLYDYSRRGTQPLVHQLVALLWCPNRIGKWEIHHIDCDRKNNAAINLLWVTPDEHDNLHDLLREGKNEEYKRKIQEIRTDNSFPDGAEPSRVISHLDYPDNPNCYMYVTPDSYDVWVKTKDDNDLVIIGESFFQEQEHTKQEDANI